MPKDRRRLRRTEPETAVAHQDGARGATESLAVTPLAFRPADGLSARALPAMQRHVGNRAVLTLMRRAEPRLATTAEPGEPAAEPGEPAAEPGEPAAEPGEPAAEPGEPAAEPGEPAAEPGEPAAEGGGGSSAHAGLDAVLGRIGQVAGQQARMPPPESKVAETAAAARGPADEVQASARARQVRQLAAAQPTPFNAAGFSAAVAQQAAGAAPRTLQDADNNKDGRQLNQVRQSVVQQVAAGSAATLGPITQVSSAAPPTAGIAAKAVTPRPANDPGPAPDSAAVQPEQIVPPARPDSDVVVPFQQNSQRLDQQLEQSDISEPQLQALNEPQADAALSSKAQTQQHAAEAPAAYRSAEQQAAGALQADASADVAQGIDQIHQARAASTRQAEQAQTESQGENETERAQLAQQFQAEFTATRARVDAILNPLEAEVVRRFDEGAERARQMFEAYVTKRVNDYKKRRYGGIWGWTRWLRDKFAGMPDEVNRFYDEGKQQYQGYLNLVIRQITEHIQTQIDAAQTAIRDGLARVDAIAAAAPEHLQDVAARERAQIAGEFGELAASIADRQQQLTDTLRTKLDEKVKELDERIAELKEANKGFLQKAWEAIKNIVDVLVGLAKALVQLLGRLASLAWKIITNIVPFFKNFFSAVGQGFKQFASNILKHLLSGLMRWLFGEVAELGVSPPTDYGFSLRGILRFVFDILGISVDGIRARVEKRYGPTLATLIVGHAAASGPTEQVSGPNPIKRILQSSDPFAEIMTELSGALSGVADNLMDELKAFIRTKLVVAGIELLVSMLSPAGAALKAAQLLIAFLRFVFENGQQVIALLNSILDSVEMVLNGNLSAAANHVEKVLADAIPLALKLFAKLLRIDGIPNIIKRTVEKVRRPIDKLFDGLLKITDKLVAPLRRAQMAVVGKVSPKRAAAMAAKRAEASEAKIAAAGKQTRETEDAVQQARARLAAEKLAVGAQGGNALQQRYRGATVRQAERDLADAERRAGRARADEARTAAKEQARGAEARQQQQRYEQQAAAQQQRDDAQQRTKEETALGRAERRATKTRRAANATKRSQAGARQAHVELAKRRGEAHQMMFDPKTADARVREQQQVVKRAERQVKRDQAMLEKRLDRQREAGAPAFRAAEQQQSRLNRARHSAAAASDALSQAAKDAGSRVAGTVAGMAGALKTRIQGLVDPAGVVAGATQRRKVAQDAIAAGEERTIAARQRALAAQQQHRDAMERFAASGGVGGKDLRRAERAHQQAERDVRNTERDAERTRRRNDREITASDAALARYQPAADARDARSRQSADARRADEDARAARADAKVDQATTALQEKQVALAAQRARRDDARAARDREQQRVVADRAQLDWKQRLRGAFTRTPETPAERAYREQKRAFRAAEGDLKQASTYLERRTKLRDARGTAALAQQRTDKERRGVEQAGREAEAKKQGRPANIAERMQARQRELGIKTRNLGTPALPNGRFLTPGADFRGLQLEATSGLPYPTGQHGRVVAAGVNFAGSDMRRANLVKANLQQADLSGVRLQMANLQNANLQGADLTGTNLVDTDLRDANLIGVRGWLSKNTSRLTNFSGATMPVVRPDGTTDPTQGVADTSWSSAFINPRRERAMRGESRVDGGQPRLTRQMVEQSLARLAQLKQERDAGIADARRREDVVEEIRYLEEFIGADYLDTITSARGANPWAAGSDARTGVSW